MRLNIIERFSNRRSRNQRKIAAAAIVPALALILAACTTAADGSPAAPGTNSNSANLAAENPTVLRLGYFPNVTHAPALVGIGDGYFEEALGDIDLELFAFNAGPSAVEALNAGAIDATFIGPSPAINAYVRSGGQAIRIIAGTSSGGAQFVVRDGIETAEDLRGTVIATPQLGNTQDVALRWWLLNHGLETSVVGQADVSVTPTANAETLILFQQGRIDGAWVPEPWSSRLVIEAGANVFLDERDLWPGGEFVVGHLIVNTEFLTQHPEAIERLLRGLVAAQDALAADPQRAKTTINEQVEAAAGAPLEYETLARSFEYLDFTLDPIAPSLQAGLDHAVAVDLTLDESLDGIYDLRILNSILTELGRPTVSAGGLGLE